MLVGAIWSAIVGFTLQRKVNRTAKRPQRAGSKSTPFTRWKAGHLMRLASATLVANWGLLLYYFQGPLWVVDTVFAAALILLIAWKPGTSPDNKIASARQ